MKILENLFARLEKAIPGKLAISFSMPVALIFGLLFIGIISWSFFMGYVVGKGQRPEEGIHEFTGIEIGKNRQDDQNPETAESSDQSSDIPVMGESGVLAANNPEDTKQFSKPQGAAAEAWPPLETPQAPKPQVKPTQRPSSPKPATVRQTSQKFDFRYQTAAFKSQNEATRLKEKLEKAGIRARAEKNGKVFLVIANFRGTDAEAATLRDKLKVLKLGPPLQLSKKAVPAKGKK